ncbi:hypothetical protein Lal_00026408 [Lupinus albus]|nr:hypothetical protein Lal_00026408 [Lupinus albus]
MGYTGGFSPERELSRLGEKWHFGAVETILKLEAVQASRLAKFQARLLAYTRYADITWLIYQGFDLPHQLKMQGVDTFLELQGKVYPSLIREFYSNFQCNDGVIMSMVMGTLITLSEELLLEVGGFKCLEYPYGRLENALMSAFEPVKVNNSLLRNTLVPRDTNHDELTTANLRLMFAIKERLKINWSLQILLTMSSIASSSSGSLVYPIFLSRLLDHLEIDTFGVKITRTNHIDHLQIGHHIHRLGICHFCGLWEYCEDLDFEIVCIEPTDEESDDEGDDSWTKFLTTTD